MEPTIFTLGYEQATQPALVTALSEAGVEVLADIRYLPQSRRPGFSKRLRKAVVEGQPCFGEVTVALKHLT